MIRFIQAIISVVSKRAAGESQETESLRLNGCLANFSKRASWFQ
jgi:hypothetical protein